MARAKRRWIQVYEDEFDDPRLSSVSGDCFRFYQRLRLLVNRIKSPDGTIQMDRRMVMACACRETFSKALRIAEEGEIAGLYSISRGCKHLEDRLCTSCAPQVHSQCTRSALIVHLHFALSKCPKSLNSRVPTKTKTKTKTKSTSTANITMEELPDLSDSWCADFIAPEGNKTGRPVPIERFRIWLAWAWHTQGMREKHYTARGFKRGVKRWWSNLDRFRRDGDPPDLRRAEEWFERLIAHAARESTPSQEVQPSPPLSENQRSAAEELFA